MTDERNSDRSHTDEPEGAVTDRCAACGTPLAAGSWHPTVARTDDGVFRLVRFCGERCRDDWCASDDGVDSC